jgi:hypothetical protein
VLDARPGDGRGDPLDEWRDRVGEIASGALHAVQPEEPQSVHAQQLGELLGPPSRDDRDDAVPPDERRERLDGAGRRNGELGTLDDRGERAVEVEEDAGGRCAAAQRPQRFVSR